MPARAPRIAILTCLLLSIAAPCVDAATPATIHGDASDGTIDGTYTLADLRAADQAVSSEQREYFGWDDVYRDHIGRLAGTSSAVVAGVANGSDSLSRRSSVDKSPSGAPATDAPVGSSGGTAGADGATAAAASDLTSNEDVTTAAVEVDDPAGRTDTSSRGVLLWAMGAIPLLILLAGAWRGWRARPTGRSQGRALSPQ